MDNGRRSALLAVLTLLALSLIAAAAVALLAGAGLTVEVSLVLGLGLGVLSFVCSQVFEASLWSALPPSVARVLGIVPPREGEP